MERGRNSNDWRSSGVLQGPRSSRYVLTVGVLLRRASVDYYVVDEPAVVVERAVGADAEPQLDALAREGAEVDPAGDVAVALANEGITAAERVAERAVDRTVVLLTAQDLSAQVDPGAVVDAGLQHAAVVESAEVSVEWGAIFEPERVPEV